MPVKYDDVAPYINKWFKYKPEKNITFYQARITQIHHTPLESKLYVDIEVPELNSHLKLIPDADFVKQVQRGVRSTRSVR